MVVNTCAFIEAARQESIDTILELSSARRSGARLVVTGCLAERYGDQLAQSLPEVDLVAGFGVPVTLGRCHGLRRPSATSLVRPLNLPRPPASAPWAYVKVAEGCDRRAASAPSPRSGALQRSRPFEAVLDEVDALGVGVHEVVLVAQDLASWGLDLSAPGRTGRGGGSRPIVDVGSGPDRSGGAGATALSLPVVARRLSDRRRDRHRRPYFDLSLQHVSRPLVKRMRRWGDAEKFLERIGIIRASAPEAALRSSFILGYPGETEDDHDLLLSFLDEAQLDWAGFFTFSEETGTYAAGLDRSVPAELAMERLRECSEMQDDITAARRAALVGEKVNVLVDEPGVGRTFREAPEIDGVIHLPGTLAVGSFTDVMVTGAAGPDLWADEVMATGGQAPPSRRAP